MISLKINEKERSYVQKGNILLHQYRQGNEWVTDDDPVFLSYPDYKKIIFLLNHCSEQRVTMLDSEVRELIPNEYIDDNYSCNWDGMCRHIFISKRMKPYYVPVDYSSV